MLAAEAELAIVDGPLALTLPQREIWIEEVKGAQTASCLALCFFAFVRRALTVLPEVRRRVKTIRQQEIIAKNSLQSDIEAGHLHLPTKELPQVVWARLPKGPYWPALMHQPYHPGQSSSHPPTCTYPSIFQHLIQNPVFFSPTHPPTHPPTFPPSPCRPPQAPSYYRPPNDSVHWRD